MGWPAKRHIALREMQSFEILDAKLPKIQQAIRERVAARRSEGSLMPQFVNCTFRPGDAKGYAYQNDGEPVKVGDEVRVPARGKDPDAWQRVTVSEILAGPPPLPPGVQCKKVLGLAPPREPKEGDKADVR